MTETILQTYLNNQFIKTTEEGNVTNLKKAVTELTKILQKKKDKIIAYTLVSIDPHISENDPVVLEVEKIIIKKWPAFKNNITATNDKGTTYIRAVILETLNKLAVDDEIAAIIWLTSKNLIKYYKIGNERDVIVNLFQHFANKTEMQGQNLWGLSQQIEMPTISIPDINVTTKIVAKDYLIKRLSASVGPNSIVDGVPIVDDGTKNRYWANSNANWAGDFGNIAGEAISSSLNTVLKSQNNTLTGIKDQINTSLQGLNPYFNEVGEIFLKSAETLNTRSQLLWWKETLYSPISCKSYRTLNPITTAIVMAIDLSNMISSVYPESVDYLLKESLKMVHGEQVDKENSIGDLIKQLTEIDEKKKSLLQKLYDKQEGRKSLGSAIANKLAEDSYDLFSDIGVANDAKVTLSEFCVWLFNDLQAKKLVLVK